MKVRIGGSTITYRGALTLTPHGGTGPAAAPDALERLEVEGSGGEARGEGTVELALSVEPRSADDGEGTALVCVGTVTGTGRLAAFEQKTATSAGVRLLDRFAAALGDSIRAEPPAGSPEAEAPGGASGDGGPEGREGPVAGGIGAPGDNERAIPGIPEPEPEPERTPLFETEVPPSSLGPRRGVGAGRGRGSGRDGRGGRAGWSGGARRRSGGAQRRGRARPAHDDRAQRGGGGPRPAARPLRPGPGPGAGLGDRHPALGRTGRRRDGGGRCRARPGAPATALTAGLAAGLLTPPLWSLYD